MQRLWIESEQDFKLQDYISKTLQIDPLIAQILINRGIKTIEGIKDFLTASLNELHNPFLLPDMKEAVERIGLATKSGEKILIYGDYDVDGVTATSLLYLFFKEIGYEASYYIPNRLRDGYGLRSEVIPSRRAMSITGEKPIRFRSFTVAMFADFSSACRSVIAPR